jgi:hypothetical protein
VQAGAGAGEPGKKTRGRSRAPARDACRKRERRQRKESRPRSRAVCLAVVPRRSTALFPQMPCAGEEIRQSRRPPPPAVPTAASRSLERLRRARYWRSSGSPRERKQLRFCEQQRQGCVSSAWLVRVARASPRKELPQR